MKPSNHLAIPLAYGVSLIADRDLSIKIPNCHAFPPITINYFSSSPPDYRLLTTSFFSLDICSSTR